MKVLSFFILGAIYAYHLPTATINERAMAKIGCDSGRIRVVKVTKIFRLYSFVFELD